VHHGAVAAAQPCGGIAIAAVGGLLFGLEHGPLAAGYACGDTLRDAFAPVLRQARRLLDAESPFGHSVGPDDGSAGRGWCVGDSGGDHLGEAGGDVRISTRTLPKLGTVLVNSTGRTLYMFVPDKRRKVTCVRTCAAVWPPVKLARGQKAGAFGRAKASLLGSDPDPAGGRVVTYAGWPLYTYVTDRSPGMAKGQALNLNGGLWYVLAPSGRVIRKKL